MKKVTIIYSPQCPWNIHFMNNIEECITPYDVAVERVDIFDEYGRAKKLLDETTIGFDRHMFIAVFIDGEYVPGHPGNPEFKRELLKTLGDSHQ